jgi:hypothetical protein
MMTNADWLSEYPGLVVDRLLVAGDIVRVAREGACEDHRPEKGEGPWSLGVSGYERTNAALTLASQEYPWLVVTNGAGGGPVQFVFTIAGHPVRVCRGDADEVPPRYQHPCLPELFDMEGVPDDTPVGRFLRLVVENAPDGSPLHIYLHEMDEETGQPVRSYLIPQVAHSTTVTEFMPPSEPPVMLPPVEAEPIEAEEPKKKTGSDDE